MNWRTYYHRRRRIAREHIRSVLGCKHIPPLVMFACGRAMTRETLIAYVIAKRT